MRSVVHLVDRQPLSGTANGRSGEPVAPVSLRAPPMKANSYCRSAASSSMFTTSMICAPAVANMYACTCRKASGSSHGITSSRADGGEGHLPLADGPPQRGADRSHPRDGDRGDGREAETGREAARHTARRLQ